MNDPSTPNELFPAPERTRTAIVRGTVVAIIFVVIGGLLIMKGKQTAGYGVTMFFVLPAATGFVTAFVIRFWNAVILSVLITLAIWMTSLVFVGLEGIVCVLMASPMLFTSALFGASLGFFIKKISGKRTSMIIAPLFAGATVFGSGQLENRLGHSLRTEVVESTIVVDAGKEDVWEELIAFTDVSGPKPFLLRIGLPIPESCSMTGSGIGAERTCHFNSGFISERVTHWEPPHRLELSVEEVKLPGRHWLGFRDATYTLKAIEKGRTRVSRKTTVTSTLRPAFYWRLFEHLGAETEHRYILNSLEDKF